METTIKKLADDLSITPKEFVQTFKINFNHEWIVEDFEENNFTSFETKEEAESYIDNYLFSDAENVYAHNTKTGRKCTVCKTVTIIDGEDEC